MGWGGFPQGQQTVGPVNDVSVGDIFELQVKGVGQGTTGLLGTKHAAIKGLFRLLFRQISRCPHKPIAEIGPPVLNRNAANHAVPIEGMLHRIARHIQQPRPIAKQGAL